MFIGYRLHRSGDILNYWACDRIPFQYRVSQRMTTGWTAVHDPPNQQPPKSWAQRSRKPPIQDPKSLPPHIFVAETNVEWPESDDPLDRTLIPG